jgi:hypothetical protein
MDIVYTAVCPSCKETGMIVEDDDGTLEALPCSCPKEDY